MPVILRQGEIRYELWGAEGSVFDSYFVIKGFYCEK